MNCEDCKGSGVYVGLLVQETCQTCNGSGKDITKLNLNDYFDDDEEDLPDGASYGASDYFDYWSDMYDEIYDDAKNYMDPFGL